VYTERFDTVELNASFYHWPRDSGFTSWRQRLPAGFQLSVKAPRGLTHGRRLREPEAWIGRISSAWHALGDRRGVLLVQLAPADERDDARLDYFLTQVPSWIRVAMEFRHPSWHTEPVFSLLERHRTAYCVMSGADLPCVLRATSDFVYVRLHGPDSNALYAGAYTSDDLRWWGDRIREWVASGKDVYAYFNNDGHGHAVRNAEALRELLND
jgi:uncharacterized protein YecE (DUF72 family)